MPADGGLLFRAIGRLAKHAGQFLPSLQHVRIVPISMRGHFSQMAQLAVDFGADARAAKPATDRAALRRLAASD